MKNDKYIKFAKSIHQSVISAQKSKKITRKTKDTALVFIDYLIKQHSISPFERDNMNQAVFHLFDPVKFYNPYDENVKQPNLNESYFNYSPNTERKLTSYTPNDYVSQDRGNVDLNIVLGIV